MKRIATVIAISAMAALPVFARDGGMKPPADLPKEMETNFKAFATDCAQCHAASRSYRARAGSQKDWERLVGAMARKPGSTLPKDDQPKIVAYLAWWAAHQKK